MKTLTIQEIVSATDGILHQGNHNTPIAAVCTDSRNIMPHSLFVPLKGDTFDGHDYIDEAFLKGSIAALSEKPIEAEGKEVILVKDTLLALQKIAALYRLKFSIPFVAISGSVGKTTTKEMVSAVLESTLDTLKTEGNFNNEIGVPLTVFRLLDHHQIAVIEMGMSGLGEIHRLSAIVKPDIAILTNIGMSHIELLGSQENIYRAKAELFQNTKKNGTIILNGDDDILWKHRNEMEQKVITAGIFNKACDCLAKDILTTEGGVSFTFHGLDQEFEVALQVPGEHNVYNALIACAVGLLQNLSAENIKSSLYSYTNTRMRMNVIKRDGYTVIDDSYNAAPASMQAAIKVLCGYKNMRKVAVLGDILSLGPYSYDAHKTVGHAVSRYGVDELYTFGNYAKLIAQGAFESGMDSSRIYSFDNMDDLLKELGKNVKNGDVVLVKASRGMQLERVTKYLLNDN